MLRATEQDRPDVAVRRRLWRSWQPFMDPERFVFIDETDASTNMIRRYGWAPRSESLVAAAPHGHWRTTTFVAGLCSTGLVAPLVLDGPMNGSAFLAYVQQFLAPTLRPGDVIVMDNLSAHKVTGVEDAIRATGASLLYLPPEVEVAPVLWTVSGLGRQQLGLHVLLVADGRAVIQCGV